MKRILYTTLTLFLTTNVPAFAKDTWLPEFDARVPVYVNQNMKSRVMLSANFTELVNQRARDRGLNVYVIVTEPGDELRHTARERWAPNTLHNRRFWNNWRHHPGFSEDRSIVLLYMRDGSDHSSTAVRVGNYLHRFGLNAALFDSPGGPVIPTARRYMKTDPQTGILKVLDNINQEVCAKETGTPITRGAKEDASEPSPFGFMLLLSGVFIVALLASNASKEQRRGDGSGCGGGSCGGSGCGGGGCGGGCGGGGCGG